MTVLSSQQVAVRPFQLETPANLSAIAGEMRKARFTASNSSSVGWGSVDDDDSQLKLPPISLITAGPPKVLPAANTLPERLRARYYWMRADGAAVRRNGTRGSWKVNTVYEAADILIWKAGPNLYSGLVTDRPQFIRIANALGKVMEGLPDRTTLTVDLIPQRLGADFFLWLLYRARSAAQLSPQVRLSGISQISSKDGKDRSVDVKDGATLERIELAASIALGVAGFGPAKFSFDSGVAGAHFNLELHPDGGFQPYKTSSYDDAAKQQLVNAEMAILIEDLWIIALPELRKLYTDDAGWHRGGPARFRKQARDEVKTLLKF